MLHIHKFYWLSASWWGGCRLWNWSYVYIWHHEVYRQWGKLPYSDNANNKVPHLRFAEKFPLQQIYTVGTGVAIGQACMILSAGNKGKRFMTAHATAMLHQPRIPSTGQRQAIELHLKWKEVLEQKKAMVDILSLTTGHSKEKIDNVEFF